MRFLFAVMADRNGVVLANIEEMAAIDAFNEKLEAAGQRILAVGLENPSSAVVIDNRHGRKRRTAGPVVEADDFMAGFWLIEVDSAELAHRLAEEASQVCNRRIEVRAVL